jgi:hypothetical protein
MTPCKGLAFFWFFELVTSDLRSTWNDAAQKLPLAPRQCNLVKKWRIVNPKMIFVKNQEVYFLEIKCKTIPVPSKSAGTCAKFKNNLQRLPQWNESWYLYPRWFNIYVWCFSSFWFRVSVVASQKTLFWHSENGKSTSRRSKRKSASVAILAIPMATHVSDMASFRQTMPCSWPNLAHLT